MTIAGLGLRCSRDLEIELCEERRIAQLGRQRVLHEGERWARAADEPFDRTEGGLAGALTERGRAAEAFEQDGRQREDIRSRSHPVVPLLVLLWRGVARGGAGKHLRALDADVGQLGEPEVAHLDHLGPLLCRDEQVRRLEIAVGDVLRMHRRDGERRLSQKPPSSMGAEPRPPCSRITSARVTP